MNAQQQDIIRILTSRGPMTSRELFDIMQDELGYWSQSVFHDQQSAAVEALSKILSKMKAENLISGSMQPQPKGRPVMAWSAPISNQQIDTTLISSQYDNPDDDTENDFGMMTETPTTHDDEHAEMESDIAELSSFAVDLQPSSHLLIMTDSKRILSGNNREMKLQRATNQLHVCLSGDLEIHNRADFAQVIGAIERMLP